MSLVAVVIALIVIGVLLWLMDTYIPMSDTIKRIIYAIVIIAIVLWLLQLFGLLDAANTIRVGPVK